MKPQSGQPRCKTRDPHGRLHDFCKGEFSPRKASHKSEKLLTGNIYEYIIAPRFSPRIASRRRFLSRCFSSLNCKALIPDECTAALLFLVPPENIAMRHKGLCLLLLGVTLVLGIVSYRHTSQAQAVCGESVECIDSQYLNSCIKTPTSLPSVNVHSSGPWYAANVGSHCGARKYLVYFAKECGPPLGTRLCTASEQA